MIEQSEEKLNEQKIKIEKLQEEVSLRDEKLKENQEKIKMLKLENKEINSKIVFFNQENENISANYREQIEEIKLNAINTSKTLSRKLIQCKKKCKSHKSKIQRKMKK